MTDRNTTGSALLNWISIDRYVGQPIHRQISAQLRQAILDGRLAPGVWLPASRVLAREISVSRNTSLHAYEQLIAEGFLETHRGAGTRVSRRPASASADQERKNVALFGMIPAHEQFVPQGLNEYLDEPPALAFQPGIPALDCFPRLIWSRLLRRHALRGDQSILDYAHIGGYGPLRQELAKYLNASRGVFCDPAQVIIVTSTRAAIAAIARVLWPAGATVAVEEPGYVVAKRVLVSLGHDLLLLPVDDRGAAIDRLQGREESCVGAYLTPAHQWPTGVTLSAERRVALVEWAVRNDAWLLEDDYDSEFRFDSAPVATLYSQGRGRVILIGTFSKVLAPSLRTAYFVVPPDLTDRFEEAIFRQGVEPPLHVQAALADLIGEGHFVRHITTMRKRYAARRGELISALKEHFGDRLQISCPAGGLQVIARLPEGTDALPIARKAIAAGFVARPMSVYYVRNSDQDDNGRARRTLHLGFAALCRRDIRREVARLHDAIKDAL